MFCTFVGLCEIIVNNNIFVVFNIIILLCYNDKRFSRYNLPMGKNNFHLLIAPPNIGNNVIVLVVARHFDTSIDIICAEFDLQLSETSTDI